MSQPGEDITALESFICTAVAGRRTTRPIPFPDLTCATCGNRLADTKLTQPGYDKVSICSSGDCISKEAEKRKQDALSNDKVADEERLQSDLLAAGYCDDCGAYPGMCAHCEGDGDE